MLSKGLFPRLGAYGALALGFWLLFQAFERPSLVMGVVGGALVLVGMYLMTGAWRDTFDRFGGTYKIRKENRTSDDTPEDSTGWTGDTVDGGDQGGQLPP